MNANSSRHHGLPTPTRAAAWSAALLTLLIPAVAMQFTDEVNWDLADFVFAGALVAGAGLLLELAVRHTADRAYRAAVAVAVGAAFLLIWINAAVGIIGDENNDANRLFFGVLAVAAIGTLLARCRPSGMSRALVATALAQLAAPVVASVAGWGDPAATPPMELIGLTAVFAALWMTSAALFRRAAQASGGPRDR